MICEEKRHILEYNIILDLCYVCMVYSIYAERENIFTHIICIIKTIHILFSCVCVLVYMYFLMVFVENYKCSTYRHG